MNRHGLAFRTRVSATDQHPTFALLQLLFVVHCETSSNETGNDDDVNHGSDTGMGRGSNRSATYGDVSRWHNHWITTAWMVW